MPDSVRVRRRQESARNLDGVHRPEYERLLPEDAIQRGPRGPYTGKYLKKESPTDGGTENPHPAEVV